MDCMIALPDNLFYSTQIHTYHAWRGEADAGKYQDIPGFCNSATLEEIRKHGYALTPGRYVGAAMEEEDEEPFDEKMRHLTKALREQMAETRRLEEAIWKNLEELGYGGWQFLIKRNGPFV